MGHPGFEPGTNRLKARVQDDPYMASRLIQGENTTLIQVFSLMLVFVIPDVSCLKHRAIAHLWLRLNWFLFTRPAFAF